MKAMHVSQVLSPSMIAGWMNRKQQAVIEYLLEENRVLKDQLAGKKLSLTEEIRRMLAIKGKAGHRLQTAARSSGPGQFLGCEVAELDS